MRAALTVMSGITPALRGGVMSLVVACAVACAGTEDVYVGSDIQPTLRTDPGDEGQATVTAGTASESPPPIDTGVTPAEPGPPAEFADAGPPPEPEQDEDDDAPVAPSCMDGLADCDGDAVNGCETMLASDPAHCGACGVACDTPDCACEDGRKVVDCPAGHEDCDGNADNGCEADVDSDLEHCGGCNRACHADGQGAARAACTAGRCELTCQLPNLQGNCDGDIENGCEADLFHDGANCGRCGMRCTACLDGLCL